MIDPRHYSFSSKLCKSGVVDTNILKILYEN